MVMVNEGLAEGVYAASGDCWSFSLEPTSYNSTQLPNEVEYRLVGEHTNPDRHNASFKVTITFNQNITALSCGLGSASVSGNVVTVVHNLYTDNPTCEAVPVLKFSCEDKSTLSYTLSWECTQ